MSVEIKIINSPTMKVAVHVSRPQWQEFLEY
jgi:hypothetical protein